MRNFKRFLTLALAVLMVVSAFAFSTSAAKFTDVDEDNEALTKAVNLLAYVGVTKGTSDTTFGTDDLVTREQMAAFIYRLMKKGNSVEGGVNQSPFADLEDETFFFMVSWANTQNIIKGTSATTFNPKGSITLQDAYTMLVRALGYEKEEALPYPFGYIEVAEGEGVELGEGLDSSVGYTDELTRGDVAILLYNTFFAETGVAETKQVEKLIGKAPAEGETDKRQYVLVTETTYPTFCEKYFDVLEVEYQAVATPNYVFGSETETTKSLGYDAVLLDYVGEETDKGDAPEQFYANVEDLGIEKADDYIMSHFTMYITLDEKDNVEEILYAEPLMKVKSTNNIKFETLAGTNVSHYFGASVANAKLLSGKAVVDGEAVYFYNAPYSYAKPTYGTGLSDAEKYELRNEKNPVFITKAILDGTSEEDGEFAWSADAGIENAYDVDDEFFAGEAADLVRAMPEVYVGGYYEADLYDVDGDGLYDYIDYKPYSVVEIDDDDEAGEFFNAEDGVLYVAYEYANVEGVEVEDEDLVVAYVDEASNYAKIVAVAEAVEAEIADIAANKGTITLSNDTKVDVKGAWKFVVDLEELEEVGYVVADYDFTFFDGLLSAANYGEEGKFFVYNGVLLATDDINATSTLDEKIAIITAPKTGDIVVTNFNATLGANTTYVYAWIDGELMYVPAEIDTDETEIFPAITGPDAEGYVDMLASYTVDKNGVYTFKLLGNAYDAAEDGEYIGFDTDVDLDAETEGHQSVLDDEDDATLQIYGTVEDGATFTKNIGKRFVLTGLDYNLLVGENTKVIIKNVYNGKTTWYTLGAADLTASIANELTKVEFVVANNPDYTNREDLLLLKAVVTGEKFKLEGATVAKNQRIVKAIDVKKNADDEYYNVYELLNPYTGETETGVVGSVTDTVLNNVASPFVVGDFVTLTGANVDEENEETYGNLITGNEGADNAEEAGIYYVVDYDAELNFVELAQGESAEAIAAAPTIRLSLEKAAITTIGKQEAKFDEDMVKWGELSVISATKLDGTDKSLKAVNKAYAGENGKLKTVYGEFLKVYVDFTEYNEVEDGIAGDVNFAIVIANAGEAADFCDLD